jgi:DNA-binding NtrC family response regulator
VLLDYRLPDIDGIEALARIHERLGSGAPPVVMLTAFATSSNTIAAMKLGAFDHLTKPVGRADVAAIIERALRSRRTAGQVSAPSAEALVGASSAMRDVQKLIGLAAAGDTTVLITGETGTGKEVVARALHDYSDRTGKPFVAVNCAAIPADLLESELFGHVKGAFSGAVADRSGCFQRASGGTLLLDEIGDMSLTMQAKILRALQEKEVSPVGAGAPVKIDVRIVAATHHDLADCVRKGTFREDLFYRLNVLPIHLPPLRERLADILPLAEHFLRLAGEPPKTLSPDAQRRLLAHSWPGNVRELKNAIERVHVLVRGSVIEAEDLGFLALDSHPASSAEWLDGDLPTAVARLERAMIAQALAESGGNRAEAARRLGIHRQLLYSKIKEHGLE